MKKQKMTDNGTVLVDIDGTLARMTGRGPHDLDRVHEDEPITHIVELVQNLRQNYQLVFMSGRKESCREATEEWLAEHVARTPQEPLFMRATNDNRRDSIIKSELFDEHIEGNYNVRFILDDRDQVVRMWRDRGLTCLQVAYGDF